MNRTNLKYRELTPDELEAVQAFAKEFGRNWRQRLAFDYWPSARIYVDRAGHEYPELHRLRNQLGPQWLTKFRLPGEYA